jgi:hypothetical protein
MSLGHTPWPAELEALTVSSIFPARIVGISNECSFVFYLSGFVTPAYTSSGACDVKWFMSPYKESNFAQLTNDVTEDTVK